MSVNHIRLVVIDKTVDNEVNPAVEGDDENPRVRSREEKRATVYPRNTDTIFRAERLFSVSARWVRTVHVGMLSPLGRGTSPPFTDGVKKIPPEEDEIAFF